MFSNPAAFGITPDRPLCLHHGLFTEYSGSCEYYAKKRADLVSCVWDSLIGDFTDNILAGTSVAIAGEKPSVALAEPALRLMARENRTSRRVLSEAFIGALEVAEKSKFACFARVVLPSAGLADPECGYVFLILAYPEEFEIKEG